MWKPISSSSSRSAVRGRANARASMRMRANIVLPSSARRENGFDGKHVPAPGFGFDAEGPASLRGETVVFGAAVVVARAPFAVDPGALLEPLERRIEGALVDVEDALRELLDALADPPAVHRLEVERLEHEEVEGAPEHVGGSRCGFVASHV